MTKDPDIRYGTALDGSHPIQPPETIESLRAACVAFVGEEATQQIERRAAEVRQEWAAYDLMARALGPERALELAIEAAKRSVE